MIRNTPYLQEYLKSATDSYNDQGQLRKKDYYKATKEQLELLKQQMKRQ